MDILLWLFYYATEDLAHGLLVIDCLLVPVDREWRWEESQGCMRVGRMPFFGVLLNHEASDRAALDDVLRDHA